MKVRKGQIWGDNDPRSRGRTLEVIGFEWQGGKEYAQCKILTAINGYPPLSWQRHSTRIRLDRFKATSTGYYLIKEAE